MRYRAEVDGLRALAVIPVILFHAGFSLFSGGFVGVDVFFVISGYLITSILIKELDAGTFSIINFYERRARRILPALFLVILASLPFAWMWLTPIDMKDFAQSLIGVATFSSNILFFLESGYFDTSAELKPLLHTWSLAVEEQYYIFFPLMLMAAWQFGRRWVLAMLIAVFIASFAYGQWAAYHRPSAAFYLLPPRGWELLIGAFIAIYLQKRDHLPSFQLNQILSLTGVGLILYATFSFDKNTPFPTFYTLAPTLGAGLIIFNAVKGTIVNRILSHKLLVGIGLISYSAYLWHQPIFALTRHRMLNEPSPWLLGLLGLFSLILAYFSWKYVEAPFRHKQRFNRKNIFVMSAIGLVTMAAIGVFGHLKEGNLYRYDAETTKALSFNSAEVPEKLYYCQREGNQYTPLDASCILGSESNIKGALVGDSHGYAISFALNELATEKNIGFYQMTFNGCPNIGSIYRQDFGADEKCADFNQEVAQHIAATPSIEYVIMVSRWTRMLSDRGFDNGEGGVEHNDHLIDIITNGVRENNPESVRIKKLQQKLENTIQHYLDAGKKVILVYPIPEVGWATPKFIAHQKLFGGGSQKNSTSYERFKERNKISFDTLNAIPEQDNLIRVYPDQVLCNSYVKDRCVFELNGEALYFDDNHLAKPGALMVVKEIFNKLNTNITSKSQP